MLEDELSKLSAVEAAARLLGCNIVRIVNSMELTGRIVEVEAYDETDAASHSFKGKTERNAVMFGPAARAYVYFTYGMHFCMNVAVGNSGYGSGVLIRAMEPISGIELMKANRRTDRLENLLNGPAKICQALNIDRSMNGHDLSQPPLLLELGRPVNERHIVWTERIGIREGKEKEKILLWRACISGSKFLSRPL